MYSTRLWVVAAELAYHQNPGVFGTIDDLPAHKARIAELGAKRAQLQERFPSTFDSCSKSRHTANGVLKQAGLPKQL